ncbi:Dynamin-1 [Dactylellina cionopaga]|nr:Dynamin-1 [Dactylellina cionopaga]
MLARHVKEESNPSSFPQSSPAPFLHAGTTSPITPANVESSTRDPSEQSPIFNEMDSESSTSKTIVNNTNKSSSGQSVNNNIKNAFASSATLVGGIPRTGESMYPSGSLQVVGKTASMGYDILGDDMREMVNTINQLRMKGVEDLGLPLPRIAVIGNQSAGKSSLIEAISGIRVPRYAGTCTRCPLEITLTEDLDPLASWHCTISLRFHKRYIKKRGDPWVDTNYQQCFFMRVDNPDNVESSLVRAQNAILNPSRQWDEFAAQLPSLAANQPTEVPFSPNVICMEITGPGIPNLSFIDLPGIIHVTERKEDEYLIKLVKNLVEGYIKQEDCLILLAMTMKDDAVNQSAAQMARKLGPNRTIGALTKPDTVMDEEHDQWVRILQGKEHRLPHGYFVTKQPNQAQLSARVSHTEARKLEDIFFENVDPWNSELSGLKHRFGTLNLQRYLSKELAGLIRQRLPEIINNVQKQRDHVQSQLDLLPPPPANSLRVVLRRLLDEYFYQIRDTVEARGDNNEFSFEWRKIAKRLKDSLIALRPRVNPDESSTRNAPSHFSAVSSFARGGSSSFAFQPASFSSSSTGSTPSKGRKRLASADDPPDESSDPFNSTHSPANGAPARKKMALEPRTPSKKIISIEDDDVMETESVADTTTMTPVEANKPMHLLEIREILEINSTTGIPGIVDSKAVEILSKMHIRFWETPVQNFIAQIAELLHSHASNYMNRIFARYENSPLYTEMSAILDTWHDMVSGEIRRIVEECFSIETECIYTMQDREWHREYMSWKADNEKRRKRAVDEQIAMKNQRAQERHAQSGRKGKAEVVEQQRDGPDPFQKEMETITNTQAYVAIARKRFGDNLMMRMMRSVFTKYTSVGSFKYFVDKELGLESLGEQEQEKKCRELMEEDPERERLRSKLIAKRELLDKAWQDLEPFQAEGRVGSIDQYDI